MEGYVTRAGLSVAHPLAAFVEERALAGTGLSADAFWRGTAAIFARFAPENRDLLAVRDRMQAAIDGWHRDRRGGDQDPAEQERFLRDIGYLVEPPAPFAIDTDGIDREVAPLAGPQLVVPVLNARFLLNAANARWGSLYDALYGTDALPGTPAPGSYDAVRGAAVVARGREFLDQTVPLRSGSWAAWDGTEPALADPSQLVGRRGGHLLFRHHGLHIELRIDGEHPIGRGDAAGVADIVLESALTTIVDLEDSVAAVDAADKVAAYANWLGVIRGDLTDTFVEERPDDHPHAGGGPALSGRRWRGAGAAGSQPVVRAQRRSSDDDARGAAARRRRGARGHPRCDRDEPGRAARRRAAGPPAQQPAPGRSTSSSPRCTARRNVHSPIGCSTRWRTCSGWRATRSRSA